MCATIARLAVTSALAEARLFLRDPGAYALPVLLPLMVLVTVGPVPLFRRTAAQAENWRLSEVYLLPLLATLLATLCAAAAVLWSAAAQRRASAAAARRGSAAGR